MTSCAFTFQKQTDESGREIELRRDLAAAKLKLQQKESVMTEKQIDSNFLKSY